jgi:hypothetical protein
MAMEWMVFVGKALLGTGLFIAILWLTQSHDPRGAGMLLTFPALNGIGLLIGESRDVYVMASAMLPMIATNGVLCAVYLLAYRYWVAPADAEPQQGKAVLAAGACLSVWGLVALLLAPSLQAWLQTPGRMGLFWVGYGVSVWPLTARLLWVSIPEHVGRKRRLWEVIHANPVKIAGMLLLIMLVMLVARRGADAWAGRLSTLPLLPFYSLLMLPAAEQDWRQGVQKLHQLGSTVLLGPLVAMAFVWTFVQYLGVLRHHDPSSVYLGAGVVGLLGLWGVCGCLIVAGVRLLRWQEQRTHVRRPVALKEQG